MVDNMYRSNQYLWFQGQEVKVKGKVVKKRRAREAAAGYMFGALSIAGLFWFYIIPFLRSIFQTLFKTDLGRLRFQGLDAYRDLFLYSAFGLALRNTLLLILVGIPLLVLCAAMLTYFINRMTVKKVRGTSFWFAVHLLPMILPSVVIATVVKIVFSTYGTINGFLVRHGQSPVPWLDSGWAFLILAVIFLWKNTGYSMVVLYSGMQGIEKEQLEAAALDGANERTAFIKIVLPQLSVFIRFVIVMGIMGIFKLYRESYLLMGESPSDEAYMVQNFLNNNFASLNYDRTIIASVLLFLVVGTLLFLLFGMTGGKDRYEKPRKKWKK